MLPTLPVEITLAIGVIALALIIWGTYKLNEKRKRKQREEEEALRKFRESQE